MEDFVTKPSEFKEHGDKILNKIEQFIISESNLNNKAYEYWNSLLYKLV